MTGRFRHLAEKALLVGAFFVLLACRQVAAAPAESCAAPESAQPVAIRYVHDGDTLTLTDNRKIRLIGINSPETAHQDQEAQPLAIKARNRLRQLLFKHGNRALLLEGLEQHDRHGRSLAHLWFPDGGNVTATLLREGMGWALTIPPNTRYTDCYLAAESGARGADAGIWSLPEYAPRASTDLPLRTRGFLRVHGPVIRVNRGGGALWINLEGRFAIRIPEADLRWFEQPPDAGWLGRRIEVRGWVYPVKGESRVTVHHPASLEILPAPLTTGH